jgi:hypothetical protein
MTARDKTIELWDKFYAICAESEGEDWVDYRVVLNSIKVVAYEMMEHPLGDKEFWQEVINEANNPTF